MIDYNIEYQDVGCDPYFYQKENNYFHPTVLFLANTRDSKALKKYVRDLADVYKSIGCSCIILPYSLEENILDTTDDKKSEIALTQMGTDIWGILNENQILNEPIFFHCVGNEGAFAYSKMASKSLADYVAGVVVESFDLGPEANSNCSLLGDNDFSLFHQLFNFVRSIFAPVELSKTLKSLSSMLPEWPELFLVEDHQVSAARSMIYSRPAGSEYKLILSKFPQYPGGELATPGLKYIFPKSYRHQVFRFIRRSCEESFKETAL